MTYSGTALLAMAVHCIVNYDALRNRHYRNITPDGKTYHLLMWSVATFYFFDAFWGVLYDAHMITAVFIDTTFYFVAMAATVFLWTRYVVNYLQERSWLTKALYYTGWVFIAFVGAVLLLNIFLPVMFWFDENGDYHAGYLRYVILIIQIVMFMASACYVLLTSTGKSQSTKRHHLAIGIISLAMSILVVIQVTFPLLPLYSISWLLGTCILHTFVLEDLKEDRRLELEGMIRREEEHRRELGSAKELAYRDFLTGVKSKNAYVEAEQHIDERIASGNMKELGVVVFDVNGLKRINDTQGHDAGDRLLKDACHLICSRFKHSPVYRIGGDEFVALLEGEDYQNRVTLLEEFERESEVNLHNNATVVASGLATFRPEDDNCYRQIFERADARMYDRKSVLKEMEKIPE